MKVKENFLMLDAIRGIAAMLVFIGHLRAIMFTNVDAASFDNIVGKAFLFITGFGHEAVIIFFVLSGFFIAKTVDNDWEKKNWTFKKYFIDRSVRLWVVLIPALIIGGVFDKVGLHFFNNEITYNGGIIFLPDVNPAAKLSFQTFLGNLFFVQTIFTPTWGSNGPLWSLANEFWYYILFGCIVLGVKNYKNKFLLLLSLIIIVVICYFSYNTILPYFSIWLTGVAIYFFTKKRKSKTVLYKIVSTIFLVAFLVAIRLKFNPNIFNDYSLCIVVCFFIWSNANTIKVNPIAEKVIKFFSNISYSLYLVHMPICLFVATAIGFINLQYNISNLLKWFFLVALLVSVVYVIWYFFEKNTYKVKRKINSIF